MNNYCLMKSAGFSIYITAVVRAFVARARCDDNGLATLWAFSWVAPIAPSLFTQLPEQSRKEVAHHATRCKDPGDLWLRSSTFDRMDDEIKNTPEGSPLDLALTAIVEEAAKDFALVAAALKARTEAAELAAITPQSDAAHTRKAGRL